jgi:ribosomal protein L11 methyltransferase
MARSPRGFIQKFSLEIVPEAEEAAAELLQDLFQETAVTEIDVEAGTTRVSVYLPPKSRNLSEWHKLRAGLERIERCGFGAPRMHLEKLRREDWAESWKRHFKPIEIGRKLLVVPSWSRRKPRRGQALVVLDPGLSFGTGQHPTTHFCLAQIASFRREREPQSFLDIGTGSGILAIAAAKLGYSPIEALDIDPDAVRIAKANARRNRVEHKIAFVQKDLTRMPLRSATKFDLICANLIFNVLIAELQRILNRLVPGGRLVLAGILRSQFPEVVQAFGQEGLELLRSKTVKEWRSGAFEPE